MAKEVLLLGKGGEDLGLALTVDGGFVALVDINYPAKDLAYLGAKHTAISIAHALLAALGEPVEAKPDRSELDAESKLRWVAIQGNSKVLDSWYSEVPLEQVINVTKGYTDTAFKVYELVAYIGPKPEPKRKVVRVP